MTGKGFGFLFEPNGHWQNPNFDCDSRGVVYYK